MYYNKMTPAEVETERQIFWNMLQAALDEKGNPFRIATKKQYGTVNRTYPDSNLCLGFDFLLQKKFFRIGIYIQDDTKTPCFERLCRQRYEIEEKLGFTPLWTMHGAKNKNTRRIETHHPFIPYDRESYKQLINQLIPIINQYVKVFSLYLPIAFEND